VLRWATAGGCLALAIVPALLLVSQSRLDDAANAFLRADCPGAVRDADSSISALTNRPQPYEIRGYCSIRDGDVRSALRDFERAVSHDPRNWTYHYDLALARGAAGLDPRGQSREAVRLNPLNQQARALEKGFAGENRLAWRRQSRQLLRGASPFYLSER
jgi:Tfp pilus assembly protein PilF